MITNDLTESIERAREQRMIVTAGALQAYGSYTGRYVRANPSVTGSVSDAAAAIPTWLTRPSGMASIASGGRSFTYLQARSVEDAFSIAKRCNEASICGATSGGQIFIPGSMASAGPVPSGIPSNGAVVFIY